MTTADTPLVTAQSVLDSIDLSERDAFNPPAEAPAGAVRHLLLTALALALAAGAVAAAGLLTGTSALTLVGAAGLLGVLLLGGEKLARLMDLS